MTARALHAELFLAALRAEAVAKRLDDKTFRQYVISLTDNCDLPAAHLTVVPDEAA